MGRNRKTTVAESSGALLVLVARVSRSEKMKELTSGWSATRWQSLCTTLSENLRTHSCLPDENLVLLPDLELCSELARTEVRRVVREVFEQHRKHSGGVSMVVLNPFTVNGIADVYFQHFFNVFISLHGLQGRVLMLRSEAVEMDS